MKTFKQFAVVLTLAIFLAPAVVMAKPRLAVLDFDIDKTAVLISKDFILASTIEDQTRMMTSELITFLVNTRKFDVMERDRINTIMREHQFDQSGVVSQDSAVNIGRMLGVQLIVLGKIETLKMESKETKIPYSDYAVKRTTGDIIINIRVVDVESGVIVSANKVKVSDQTKGDVATELFYDNLKEKAAQRITSQIINGVFPIRIVGIEGQTVFLNYGKGAAQYSVGDELDVYQTGEDMIDPDSGESLGPKEKYLGKIKVKAIERKKSVAIITESVEPIVTGAICKTSAVSRESTATVQGKNSRTAPKQKVNW